MTCEICTDRHPATGKSEKDLKGYDCQTNCPKPKLLPANVETIEVINRFGAMIYNGESVSAYGIEKAMDWAGINPDAYANTANKIVLYYATISTVIAEQRQKELKHGTKKNTNRPRGK